MKDSVYVLENDFESRVVSEEEYLAHLKKQKDQDHGGHFVDKDVLIKFIEGHKKIIEAMEKVIGMLEESGE